MRNGLRKFVTSKLIWIFALLHLIYLFVVLLLPKQDLITLMNGLLFCVAAAVCVTFMRETVRIIVLGNVDREDYLLLGIVISWASDVFIRAWVSVMRFLGRPESIVDHPILGLFILWSIIGGSLHLAAPNAFRGKVPTENWVKLGITVLFGTTIAFILIFLRATQMQ